MCHVCRDNSSLTPGMRCMGRMRGKTRKVSSLVLTACCCWCHLHWEGAIGWTLEVRTLLGGEMRKLDIRDDFGQPSLGEDQRSINQHIFACLFLCPSTKTNIKSHPRQGGPVAIPTSTINPAKVLKSCHLVMVDHGGKGSGEGDSQGILSITSC